MKHLKILLCIVMIISVLCGCDSAMSGSSYIGKWIVKSYDYTQSDMLATDSMKDYYIKLKENGHYTAVLGDGKVTGNWSETDDGVLLEGETPARLHLEDDGSLSLILDDDMIIYFSLE